MQNADIEIFIVEDNEVYNALITEYISQNSSFKVTSFLSGEAMIEVLKTGKLPHIIVSDYNLNGRVIDNAMDLINATSKFSSSIPIIILTAQNELKLAIELLKQGAFEFIVKDDYAFQRIVKTLDNVSELVILKEEIYINNKKRKKDIKRLGIAIFAAIAILASFIFLNY